MKSRSERSTDGGEKKMEGVNMPASLKSAWRWMVGATAAALVGVVALPGVGHATNIEICINNNNGRIKGINLGFDECGSNQTELDWVTTGPAGPVGPTGITGNPGPVGQQGPEGAAGPQGPSGAEGVPGPQGPEGVAGPTGPTGPAGVMGENGVRGPTGLVGPTGLTGPSGIPGIIEPNISVLTGGTLGTLGFLSGTDLSGFNTVSGNVLQMGPGNGSDASATSMNVGVPMPNPGTATRLFVDVDADPGTQNNFGQPTAYVFSLCDDTAGSCGLTCTIVGPDTACTDLSDSQTFAQGDVMTLEAFSSYFEANHADVKWSVTYTHAAPITPPI